MQKIEPHHGPEHKDHQRFHALAAPEQEDKKHKYEGTEGREVAEHFDGAA